MPTPRLFLDPGLVADGRLDGDVAAGVDDALVTVINTLILETWLEPVVLVTLDPDGIGGATVTAVELAVTVAITGIVGAAVTTAGCDVIAKGCVVTSKPVIGKGCDVIAPRELVFMEYTN